MSLQQTAFTILTVISLAIGQILFKMASSTIEFNAKGFFSSLLNTKLIMALLVYGIATIMWLAVLKAAPLRLAYPFVAIAFFVVPVLAHFLLDEAVGWNTFVGAVLIASGVWVSVYR